MVEILDIRNIVIKKVNSSIINFHFLNSVQSLKTTENAVRVLKNVIIEVRSALNDVDLFIFAKRAYLNFENKSKTIIIEEYKNLLDLKNDEIKEVILNKKNQKIQYREIKIVNRNISSGNVTIENMFLLDELESKYLIGKLVYREYKNMGK